MHRAIWAGLVAGMGLAGAACAQEGPPPLPPKSAFVRTPTAAELAQYYPAEAVTRGQSGYAVVDCAIEAAGKLRDCRVLLDGPEGAGFGQAALSLADVFRLEMKTIEPSTTRWLQPIVFAMPNWTQPRLGLTPTDSSLVDLSAKPADKGAWACPSKDNPQRFCSSHPIRWARQPWLTEILPALTLSDQTTGESVLQCAVSPEGRLVRCATSNTTPKARAAMLAAANLYVAPKRAEDRTLVGEGPIALLFDWTKLSVVPRVLATAGR